jgi:hypothetical protein|tara:strand:- start:5551 stop:6018 length:468 start_codon:yes stop_codon:yes gene_type:complete
MAASDKNIVITPNKGHASNSPKIVFSAASGSTNAQDITLEAKPLGGNTDGASLNFTGEHNGALMSLTDSFGGSLFSVSGADGLPLLDVNESGNINLSFAKGSVSLPSGGTADRPNSPEGGAIRWNSDSSSIEAYDGDKWVEIITDYFPTGSTIID